MHSLVQPIKKKPKKINKQRTFSFGPALQRGESVVSGHAAEDGVEGIAADDAEVGEQRFEGRDALLLGL